MGIRCEKCREIRYQRVSNWKELLRIVEASNGPRDRVTQITCAAMCERFSFSIEAGARAVYRGDNRRLIEIDGAGTRSILIALVSADTLCAAGFAGRSHGENVSVVT